MYTKQQVDEMLSQVEQEFEKTLGSITKNESINEEFETEEFETEEVMTKSEESEEESEESYETIDELYASMTKSEKEAHYESIKKNLFEENEVKEEAMTKSEESEEESEEEGSLLKSENNELKKQNEGLKKSYDQINELLNKMFNSKKAPAQKAITSANYIAKSEEIENEVAQEDLSKLSKGEITSRLKKVDQSSLTKSDRDVINDFYLKNASVDTIKHLIIE